MPDAAAVAPAPAPVAPVAAAPKVDAKPYQYDFVPTQGSWGVDGFLRNQYLEGTIKFSAELIATYRTLTVDETQAVESAPDITNPKVSIKFAANEMSIAQIYHSLQSVNGTPMPPVPAEFGTKDYKAEADPRRKWVRKLPGVMFDLLLRGLTEFERRAKEAISPEAVKNF